MSEAEILGTFSGRDTNKQAGTLIDRTLANSICAPMILGRDPKHDKPSYSITVLILNCVFEALT